MRTNLGGKKQRELRKSKMATCLEKELLEVEAKIPESSSSNTTIESACEMVAVGTSSPSGDEDQTHDLSETAESYQKSSMVGPGDGSNLISRPGDVVPLARFDVLRFKNNFLEMVEELRLRRAQDFDNMKRIQELLADKHELIQNLDEAASKHKSLTDDHTTELQEFTKKHAEQLQQYKNDHVKSNLLRENREKELKALKDEMRALHLTKHNLEKKVQEQDRQLQLQNSSRENHLNKMLQLEEKCSFLFSLAEDVKEQIERLEVNVKQAGELHHKLVYVNNHQKCELSELQQTLNTCHQELVRHRAQALTETNKSNLGTNLTVKLKTSEHELKLQVELCKHLQDELGSLRGEHQGVLRQMKDAHTLLEKHVESNSKCLEKEEELKKEVEDLQSQVKKLTASLLTTQEEQKNGSERHQQEMNDREEMIDDTKHRLMALQTDFKALQDSYESLDTSKSDMKTEQVLLMQQTTENHEKLEKNLAMLKSINKEFESKECSLEKQLESFRSALDQSEAELAKCETKLKVKEQLVFELERDKTQSAINRQQVRLVVQKERTQEAKVTYQLSPEVIVSTNEPELNTPLGPVLKDTPFSPQEDCIYNECQPTAEHISESSTNHTLCYDRASPDLAPEAKRAKLQSSSHQISPTQLESEAPLGPHRSDVVDELDSKPCQSFPRLSGSSDDKVGGTASSISPREIKESPLLPLATPIDNGSAVGVYRKEKEHLTLSSGDKPVSSQICGLREKNESLIFSPEQSDEENNLMISTQINRQIKRVEKFLKADRLRRPKK